MSSKSYLDPDGSIRRHQQLMSETAKKVSTALVNVNPTPSRQWYERLKEHITDFESKLDSTTEVGANLVSFAGAHTFHITGLGYHGPDMIIFHGTNENGEKMKLL